MNKKISLLFCFALIVSAFVPIVATALAGKPDNVPPPLEKKVFIHYRKGYGKPDGTPGKGPKKGEDGHYKLLGKGIKWKTLPVSYVIDDELAFFATAIYASAEEWDTYTSSELFSDNYQIVTDGSWDDEVRDGRNELVLGDYEAPGVIAVCIIWGYFSGPPPYRKIVEFDILFDIDYIWGDATLDPTVMDIQNIATHEFGHGIGLDDLYDSSASEETMYGYSQYGETKKRTLYIGDKAGLHELYGE